MSAVDTYTAKLRGGERATPDEIAAEAEVNSRRRPLRERRALQASRTTLKGLSPA